MTTRPCFLDSVRIASTSTGKLKVEADGAPPRSTLLSMSMSIVLAELTAGASDP
jgi:hypothetical protein